ncbi:hypothetical protein [Azorhizobium sp. AG788]|uniref:hypothetical protein n=1 Tax=Azorhizobium sp. AG788 TaxID=2183897 RepID=UPI00105C45D2|nr:hypothetical protein [Azorhizobium sp. AG788]
MRQLGCELAAVSGSLRGINAFLCILRGPRAGETVIRQQAEETADEKLAGSLGPLRILMIEEDQVMAVKPPAGNRTPGSLDDSRYAKYASLPGRSHPASPLPRFPEGFLEALPHCGQGGILDTTNGRRHEPDRSPHLDAGLHGTGEALLYLERSAWHAGWTEDGRVAPIDAGRVGPAFAGKMNGDIVNLMPSPAASAYCRSSGSVFWTKKTSDAMAKIVPTSRRRKRAFGGFLLALPMPCFLVVEDREKRSTSTDKARPSGQAGDVAPRAGRRRRDMGIDRDAW